MGVTANITFVFFVRIPDSLTPTEEKKLNSGYYV